MSDLPIDLPPDTSGQLLGDAIRHYRDRFGLGVPSLMCPPELWPELTAALNGAIAPIDAETMRRLCGGNPEGPTPGALI